MLGVDVGANEDGGSWLAFVLCLNARNLSGVEPTISEALQGLKQAVATAFTGVGWQRCRTHSMVRPLTQAPRRCQLGIAITVRTIHQQLSPE